MSDSALDMEGFWLGDREVDLHRRQVSRGDAVTRLTATEVRLLSYLLDRAPATVSREELLSEVWGYAAGVQTRAVHHAVTRLRKKIEDNPKEPRCLVAVYGEGYRLEHARLPSVSESDQVASLRALPSGEVSRTLKVYRTGNLPSRGETLFGRERQLESLTSVWEAGTRLVTVTGPGGGGKSVFVESFGRRSLADYPGGVWWCALASVSDLEGLVTGVAEMLGVVTDTETPVERVGQTLVGLGRVLLILDSFEHLLDHAGETITRWLETAPDLHVLVTSRRPLHLRSETNFPLEVLVCPESSDPAWAEHPALQLFAARVAARQPGFVLTEEHRIDACALVRALDGLPLAIELAAARVPTLGLAGLRKRLDRRFAILRRRGGDGPDRHATLHGALQGSWELLSVEQQAVLAQCSTFAGVFDLEGAEAVVSVGGGSPVEVVDLLSDLVDHSLVVVDTSVHGRQSFRLPNSVKAFAASALAALPAEAGALARHGWYFAGLGRGGLRAQWTGGEPKARTLMRYRGDLRAAFERAADSDLGIFMGAGLGLLVLGMRQGPISDALEVAKTLSERREADRSDVLTAALCHAWLHHLVGRATLAAALAREVLRRATEEALEELQIACRVWLGRLERVVGDPEAAEEHLHGIVEVCRERGLEGLEVEARVHLGALAKARGSMAEARAHYEGALLALGSELGGRLRAEVLGSLAATLNELGDPKTEEAYVEALEACRVADARVRYGMTLCNQGVYFMRKGDLGRAREVLEEAAAIARGIGDERVLTLSLANLGSVAHNQGRRPEARVWLEEARRLQARAGNVRGAVRTTAFLGLIAAEEGLVAEAFSLYGEALERAESVEDLGGVVYVTQVRGLLALETGDLQAARRDLLRSVTGGRVGDLRAYYAPSLSMLSVVHARLGDVASAREQTEEALALLREMNRPLELALCLVRAVEVATAGEDFVAARAWLAEARCLEKGLGTGPEAVLARQFARLERVIARWPSE